MIYEFKLPDVGEGLAEGEIVKWHVKEGDRIEENQPLVSVLTDKAEVEIPSPKTGKIVKLFAQAGQKVAVGGTLVSFEVAGNGRSPVAPGGPIRSSIVSPGTAGSGGVPAAAGTSHATAGVSATPAVRKLAQDLRVDLTRVRGTGPAGRVTETDVRAAAGSGTPPAARPSAVSPGTAGGGTVPAGPEERVPFAGIRRRTAEKMVLAAKTIPHVAHADEADCTALAALRNELKPEADKRGVKLTYLAFILKALAKSLQQFPNLNAELDEQKQEIVHKKYYHLGIATATDHGLYVPVVRDADKKSIWELASDIERLAAKVRDNKIEISELQGGTFTVTNIGPIGGTHAIPIIQHPQAAILALMKLQDRPVARDGAVVIRSMMNLVLSFDHRILDGAEAAQFMSALVRHIENPRTLL